MSFSEKTVTSSFSKILDNFTEGLVILNSTHQIIFTSNFFLSLIGFSSDELIEKSVENLFPKKKAN